VKTFVLEYWTPLLVWLIAIFQASTDRYAAGETSRFIGPLLLFLFPGLAPHDVEFWHAVIRKCAHVGAYFILAFLAYRCCKSQMHLVDAKVRAGMLVLLTALLDEFNQSFTISRGGSLLDVGYDCLGGVSALWLMTTYETRRIRSYSVL
jgi:VanZ family protein